MTATHRERKEASEDGGRSWSRAGPSTSPTGSFGTTRPSSRAGAGSSTQRARSTSTARWSWTTRPPGAAEESSTRSGCRHDPERKPYEREHGDLQRRRGRQHDGIDTLDSDVQIRSHAATAGGIRTGEGHAEPRWHRSVSTSRTTRRTISPTRAARQSVMRRRRAAPRARARHVAGATPLRSR
jgi:hypothetical protein